MKAVFTRSLLLSTAVIVSACSGSLPGQEETTSAPPPADNTTANGEWLTWGGDASFTRYAPLSQINADTIDEVGIAWRWSAPPWETRPDTNLKATPLYVDGVLYAPAGVNQVVALDPATGEEIWRYTPDPLVIPGRSEAISSRAVSYWTDGETARIIHNTRDGRLLSINAETGEADTSFGENGMVFLRENLRPDGDVAPFVGSSSPAAIVGDIIVAQMVADITPQNKEATPGHIRGYDVRTGELVWTFHTIPQEGEFGNDTWGGDSWKFTGNNGVWSMISVDEERGLVYLPIEAPSHDFYGGHREGDNLFSQSIVCLDGATGERVWHFQMVHHGLWDYDPPAAPILHDIVIDGEVIPAVTQLTKQGMSFVFNRVTGEPVWPIEELPVPQSDVPGEVSSPTQPFPTLPEYYVPHGFSEDNLIDFTPELKAEALEIASRYVTGPIYTPPTPIIECGTQGTWVEPNYGGGSNWNGGAFDPETAQMFVPVRSGAFIASLGETDDSLTNWDYLRMPTGRAPGPQGLPITKPPYAYVVATDMNSGHHTWQMPIGGAPDWIREHPALEGLDLDFDSMGQVGVRPVPLVTSEFFFLAESGNLSGDPGGPLFRAYDKENGSVIAEIELPERASGGPMTYMHEGEQYIVIAVGSAEHPSELVALKVLDEGETPAFMPGEEETSEADATDLVRPVFDKAVLDAGRPVYAVYCAACHGASGESVAGGPPPIDRLIDVETIRTRVVQGGIEMPAMNAILSEDEIDAVSKYVAAGLPPETEE